MKIREVAEPLHTVKARAQPDRGPDMAALYNAGIDAVVDAVEQLDYVLVPRELVTALSNDLGDLERAFEAYTNGSQRVSLFFDASAFRQQHWPAVREFLALTCG